MLELPADSYSQMVAHALDGVPYEACGLLVGVRDGDRGTLVRFEPTTNVAQSSKLYEVDPRQHLKIERAADDDGLEVIGVMHSHTHTAPFPSPTDVRQAPDPGWHYVIVSLAGSFPSLRSYRIVDGNIAEEPVVVPNG